MLTSATQDEQQETDQVESDEEVEQRMADLIGPVYDVEDVAVILDMDEDDVLDDTFSGEILSMRTSDGYIVYPEWQFHEGAVRAGVVEALGRLRGVGISDWSCVLWFLGASSGLNDMNAKDWLLTGGDPEEVVTQAAHTASGWRY